MDEAQDQRIIVRAAEPHDAFAVAQIYNHYVTTSIITFEEKPAEVAEIAQRIREAQSASLPWIVAENGARVVGFAYATPWRKRSAYRFSLESTVYVEHQCLSRGVGSRLYSELIATLRNGRMHSVIAGIALPNPASIALHEKFGFRKVAEFHEVGFKFGKWINVGYWQLTL